MIKARGSEPDEFGKTLTQAVPGELKPQLPDLTRARGFELKVRFC